MKKIIRNITLRYLYFNFINSIIHSIEKFSNSNPINILEICSGNGLLAHILYRMLISLNLAVASYKCVDLVSPMRNLDNRITFLSKNIDFLVDSDFNTNIDILFCINSLQCLKSLKSITNIVKKLHPNFLVFIIPSDEAMNFYNIKSPESNLIHNLDKWSNEIKYHLIEVTPIKCISPYRLKFYNIKNLLTSIFMTIYKSTFGIYDYKLFVYSID